MKNHFSIFITTLLCVFSFSVLAQENLKSSKILYDTGLEEIYDVQEYNGGYIALGHKGDEATTKKLWLIKFDKELHVIGSKVVYNQALVSPFRLRKLTNGNVLVLAQDVSAALQRSVLFCLHPEGALSWSKNFSADVNIELSDMAVGPRQEVYLYGAKKHIINTYPNNDRALLIKIDQQGNQLWQKEIAMGSVELKTKQLLLDKNNELVLTGTLVDVEPAKSQQQTIEFTKEVEDFSFVADTTYVENAVTGELEMHIYPKGQKSEQAKMVEVKNRINALGNHYAKIINDYKTGKPGLHLFPAKDKTVFDTIYVEDPVKGELTMTIIERKETKAEKGKIVKTNLEKDRRKTNGNISFYSMKVSLIGEVLAKNAINRYADYSFSNGVIENDAGYLFLLQSANYFGDGMILQTDKNLKTISRHALSGAPILYSGFFQQENHYVVGGVFSNTFKDYSPGFIFLDRDFKVLQAKSSKSLFSHFFISNIAPMKDNSFMLSGIGYEHNQPSDIYFMPFTTDGKSACDLEYYSLKTKTPTEPTSYDLITQVTNINQVKIENAQFALADENKFTSGNVCTTPDQHPVDNKENGSWNQWNNKNADAFTLKIPSDWIQVSPNPSKGLFTVQYDGMQNENGLKVIVTDIRGRTVYNRFLQNQDVFQLNLSKLGPGIYNLQIHDGSKSQTKKITVMK